MNPLPFQMGEHVQWTRGDASGIVTGYKQYVDDDGDVVTLIKFTTADGKEFDEYPRFLTLEATDLSHELMHATRNEGK
jgi:hypothetical protein